MISQGTGGKKTLFTANLDRELRTGVPAHENGHAYVELYIYGGKIMALGGRR